MARFNARVKPVSKPDTNDKIVEPTSTPFAPEPVEASDDSSDVVATEWLVITDPVRRREIKYESVRAAEKAYRSVARRLGRVRRAFMSLDIDGEFIVDADHAQWVKKSDINPAAHVVFVTQSGLIRIPMESEARAARVARDSSIRLLSGREAVVENALDGAHAVFHAYSVRVEPVT